MVRSFTVCQFFKAPKPKTIAFQANNSHSCTKYTVSYIYIYIFIFQFLKKPSRIPYFCCPPHAFLGQDQDNQKPRILKQQQRQNRKVKQKIHHKNPQSNNIYMCLSKKSKMPKQLRRLKFDHVDPINTIIFYLRCLPGTFLDTSQIEDLYKYNIQQLQFLLSLR